MQAASTDGGEYNRGVIGLLRVVSVIMILGALNWGLIGFFNYNLVDDVFGGSGIAHANAGSRVLYALVGLAGIGALVLLPALNRSALGPDETGTPRWVRR